MNRELIVAVNFEVLGLGAVLGMTPEAVLKDCSIRELMIYLALRPDSAMTEPSPGDISPVAATSSEAPQEMIRDILADLKAA